MMETTRTEINIDSDIYELVPGFSEARRKELDTLRKALAADDFLTIAKISHTVKGIARPYGFPTLEALFVRLEQSAKSANAEACRSILSQVEEYFNQYNF
ncbi:MAG: Hpt protein [Pseudobdellovibrio sp.]|jgi:HPt (histidine-containing phosphotransfer) domain-containing protein|nr:Hpt protein [Pseudobdellovibrio sp.]